jgi:hypothetical protein
VLVLDDLDCPGSTGKTRDVAQRLRRMIPEGHRGSWLLVDASKESEEGQRLRRAAGNVPGVVITPVPGLNVWQILKQDYLVISKEAVAAVAARLDAPNLRGWRIREPGYVSPWVRLVRENERKRAEMMKTGESSLGAATAGRVRVKASRVSVVDRMFKHRIEVYPGRERPR